MGQMTLRDGHLPVLRLEGDFFGENNIELVKQLKQMLFDYNEIVVDLQNVTLFDSVMLGALLSQAVIYQKLYKKMTVVINRNEETYINALFDVTGIEEAFKEMKGITIKKQLPKKK